MAEDKNVVLIGMPGAGKSTLGVLLAKAINYSFLDTDLVIQQKQGRKLYEIINEQGIDAFLDIENRQLCDIEVRNTVIATGGSAIYGRAAMEHLRENGTIVYIKLSLEEIEHRVNNIKTRGIAMRKGKTLAEVYEERIPIYESYADIVVDGDRTTIEEGVELIIDALYK